MPMQTLSLQELKQFLDQASHLANESVREATHDNLSFFKHLAEKPETLAQWAIKQTLQTGEIIFEEGESGDALYLILSGQLAVITSRLESPHLVAVRGSGEVIGEMALVEKRPRMATVAALGVADLICISRENFHQLLQVNPEFGLELMCILSERLRTETRRQSPHSSGKELNDPLTGAYTRAAFTARLHEMAEQSHRYGRIFTLLMIDLDHFKSINDSFGHARGDDVLKEFARRVRATLREGDLFFRYGGDEFCILLPESGNSQAITLAWRLLEAMQITPIAGTPPLTLTMSVGVAEFPADVNAAAPEALIDIADHRAYQAKRSGRARVVGREEIAVVPSVDSLMPEISRLIERDQALENMRAFFGQLNLMRHGGLWVRGQTGYGNSRFLREVAANAHLRNYAVFMLSGAQKVQTQPYGAALAARQMQQESASVWPPPDSPTPLAEVLAVTLPPYVIERKQDGVLITIDNADQLDQATRSGLRQLLATVFVFPVGIAYAGAEQNLFDNDIYQLEIVLEPFSTQGVLLWLRQSLSWEAPLAFAGRLLQVTDGSPARLQQEVARLIETGALTLTPDGWVLRDGEI